MEVGDLISLYRKQAGMTIDELAERSGVPKGTINKIIGGVTKAPTLPNMKSIARALGKTLADFDDLPIGETKKSPDADESAPRDSKESEIIQLLEAAQLDDSQKDFLIALLETVTARNQQRRPAVQVSVDGIVPVSERHDQT